MAIGERERAHGQRIASDEFRARRLDKFFGQRQGADPHRTHAENALCHQSRQQYVFDQSRRSCGKDQ